MTKLELITPEKAALERAKTLEEILAMTFDPPVKTELERIVEEIRGLKQRIARLEAAGARQANTPEGRKHRSLRPAGQLRVVGTTPESDKPS